jgi:hypothetical protein
VANLSGLILRLETDKGVAIHDCAIEAVHIASVLHVTVEFTFNDVKCFAHCGENPLAVIQRYLRHLEQMAEAYHPVNIPPPPEDTH